MISTLVARRAAAAVLAAMVIVPLGGGDAQTPPAPPRARPDAASGRTAPQSATDNEVVVTGRRGPTAEAPKWETCAKMMGRRLQMPTIGGLDAEPQIYLPTRAPRNPDYRAPPKVPIGSPLPDLSKTRFGASADSGDIPGTGPAVELDADGTADPSQDPDTAAVNRAACIQFYSRFSDRSAANGLEPMGRDAMRAEFPGAGSGRDLSQIAALGRAERVANDTTLPMAFALFDQGRYAEALTWFRKAERNLDSIEGGDEASLFIGKLTLAGFGETKNPVEAIKWLKLAAEANFDPLRHMPEFDPRRPQMNTASGEAAMILATIYQAGMPGVPRDMVQACKWYDRAEAVGHVAAGKVLGDIYYRGLGVPRDVKAAAKYYERAAKTDLPSAQVALANILEFGGEGVPPNVPKALGWYQQAAKHDDPEAMYALAIAYDTGKVFAVNQKTAFTFYSSAALKGLPAAQVAVGSYFQDGTVVARDDATARRWFELAARQGEVEGMYSLAALLANGRGGPRDTPGSWAWLKRAAAKGHAGAATALAKLEATMTPADKQSAAARLAAL